MGKCAQGGASSKAPAKTRPLVGLSVEDYQNFVANAELLEEGFFAYDESLEAKPERRVSEFEPPISSLYRMSKLRRYYAIRYGDKCPADEFAMECCRKGLIGASHFFRSSILSAVKDCCNNSSPVLISGETGTGKEAVAKCIHQMGKYKDKKFVAVNCGAIPSELLESEIFGIAKGAATGITDDRPGFVEEADGGILFLDEIGEMSPAMQGKMLRFLNDGTFYRVGERKERSVETRIISATNRDIENEIKNGNFKEDLYCRINTMQIDIWPLCLRPGDLLILTYFFIQEFNAKNNDQIKAVTIKFLTQLLEHRWKGNARELKNSIERLGNVMKAENSDCFFMLDFGLDGVETISKSIEKYIPVIPIEDLCKVDLSGIMEDRGKHARAAPDFWKFEERLRMIAEERREMDISPDDYEPFSFEGVILRRFGDPQEDTREFGNEPSSQKNEEYRASELLAQAKEEVWDELLKLKYKALRRKYSRRLLEKHDTIKSAHEAAGTSYKTFNKWLNWVDPDLSSTE